jgi:hypothetical protein
MQPEKGARDDAGVLLGSANGRFAESWESMANEGVGRSEPFADGTVGHRQVPTLNGRSQASALGNAIPGDWR